MSGEPTMFLIGDTEDFIQKNGVWILSMLGMMGAGCASLLTCFLRSRCTSIKCCCWECEREVIEIGVRDTEIGQRQHRLSVAVNNSQQASIS